MSKDFELNADQKTAIDAIKQFMKDPEQDAFILCGSAGTGKTTLVAKIIELLRGMGLGCMMVAPTGRAARILQSKLNKMLPVDMGPLLVSTLHGAIYYLAEMSLDETRAEYGQSALQMHFPIKKQGDSFDLVIVDEASMVGDMKIPQNTMRFGSGRLLSDLVYFLNRVQENNPGQRPIKLMFVGDLAQLSPVGSENSPALSPEYLQKRFNMNVQRYELTMVMRQAAKSGILDLANSIRKEIFEPTGNAINIESNNNDILVADQIDAVSIIVSNINMLQSSAAVVYSNEKALKYNVAVRHRLWGNGWRAVKSGDQLLVTRNSAKLGVSNGDIIMLKSAALKPIIKVVVLSDGTEVELKFRLVVFQTDMILGQGIECLILENLLFAKNRDLSDDEQTAMVRYFHQRYPYQDPDSDEYHQLMMEDPYYNALQVKFGYALTCHKAQGGEWDQVIIDISGVRMCEDTGLRWLYTAVTRAAQSLCVVEGGRA
ncbi:hypothetical protein LH51_01075 [Nitrincola sp. A-D6]|uniref:ATP-dependent DNA helicase n=1 Tax=Nitrincola sp. A-D6 TaxID=1545442 RepID=UPI00051FC325|nr:DEAD/DEAH box helicase [Nitrincola sp. A-D6]KGK43260.1 hypothetical protein LH51_01075 [Nitrincola sp. A-D6]